MKNNFQEKDNKQMETMVKVYVRINSTRKGTDFKAKSQISQTDLISQLLDVIRQKNLIQESKDDLVFVIQGRQLNSQSLQIIKLRPLSIIHVIHKISSQIQKLNLTLRYINVDQESDIKYQVNVNANDQIQESIGQVVQRQFNKFTSQISLVFSGHQISLSKTFFQESVQNNSEIIVIDRLKSGKQQNQFQYAEQMNLNAFGINLQNTKHVEKKDSLEQTGLYMPFNPKIHQSKVKQLLQQNFNANVIQIQQNQHHNQQIMDHFSQYAAPELIGSVSNSHTSINLSQLNINQDEQSTNVVQSSDELNQAPHLIQNHTHDKMDEQKEIPTKDQIQQQKNSTKNIQIQNQNEQTF